jgi:hypothetical protein
MHEDKMANAIKYPEFYAAGWFVDVNCESELVVVSHGDTMQEATNSMMEAVKLLDWNDLSATIR